MPTKAEVIVYREFLTGRRTIGDVLMEESYGQELGFDETCSDGT